MIRMSSGNRAAVHSEPIPVYRDPGIVLNEPDEPIRTLSNGINTVKLICAFRSDTIFLTEILQNLGFSSQSNVTVLRAERGAIERNTSPAAFAAIVCHRQVKSHPAAARSLASLAERVIVLSDCLNEDTVINLLGNGARHVFDIRESHTLVHARLDAALRHHQSSMQRALTVGDIHLDRQRSKASRGGLPVKLTPKEFAFACQLFSRVGEVVCNEELMTSIWSLPPKMDTRRIDSAASLVRKKLRLVCHEGWELKRIRCVGYQLIRMSDNCLQ